MDVYRTNLQGPTGKEMLAFAGDVGKPKKSWCTGVFQWFKTKQARRKAKKELRDIIDIIRGTVKNHWKNVPKTYLHPWGEEPQDYDYRKVFVVGNVRIEYTRYIRGDVCEVFYGDSKNFVIAYVDQSHQYPTAFSLPHDIELKTNLVELTENIRRKE